MAKNKTKDFFEDTSNVLPQKDEIQQKVNRALSVLNNINRDGGIATQLQMAAACIELQSFELYLLNKYNDNVIDRNDFPDLPMIEEYIRLFKNAESDFKYTLYEGKDHFKQREKDIWIISYLRDTIMEDDVRGVNNSDYAILDSWKCLQTDIDMLWGILYHLIRLIVLGFESIYQEIRKQVAETTSNTTSQKKRKLRKYFREFVKDKERTEDIVGKIHRLIGNKTNTTAADIIKEAMWIKLIDRPTIPSIREEFPTIKCSDTPISNKLNEALPTKNGKVDEGKLDIIIEKFEQA